MKLLKAVAVLFLSLSLVVGCSSGNSGGNATKENTPTNTGEAPTSEAVKNEKSDPDHDRCKVLERWEMGGGSLDHPVFEREIQCRHQAAAH